MTTQQAQRKAAVWFVQGKSVTYVAKQLHMARSVIEQWKADVRFLDMMGQIEVIQNEMYDYKLRLLKRQAVDVLKKALESDNPRDYQWAVSKLFAIPVDLLCSPSASRSLSFESEEETEDRLPTVHTQAQPVLVATAAQASDRQSLMKFLDSTRGLERPQLPDTN